ncbi:MAG TPA: hypothetical protein VF194_13215 [Ferrovibrio sp.]|uniref:hypothetical protein n=1 Tax=Ferrovibrio sp. TaxID=1917215 RepID=UPI002ED246B2
MVISTIAMLMISSSSRLVGRVIWISRSAPLQQQNDDYAGATHFGSDLYGIPYFLPSIRKTA